MLKKAIIFTIVFIASGIAFVPIVFADGLVPCTGVNCTICDFFRLFQNVFNMALTVVPIVAVIFVSIAGYYFMIAGGDTGKISKAKSILWHTFVGIAIFYSSYVLASFTLGFFARSNGGIDFGFTKGGFVFNCSGGEIENKLGGLLDGGRIVISIPGEPVKEVKINQVGKLNVSSGVDIATLDADVNSALDDASLDSALSAQGIGLLVTSGVRSYQKQMEEVARNCAPISAGSCILKDANSVVVCIPQQSAGGSNCPHVAGKAVDVWASQSGQQKKNLQNEVIDAMKTSGFCVLKSENWHFELESQIADARKGAFDCP